MRFNTDTNEVVDGVLMCKCGRNPASSPHVCSFDKEIHDGNRICICCAECTKECYEDT